MAATMQLMYSELQNKFGLTDFKSESQKEVTKHVYEDALIEQRDIFINMPSGFGKSLCFQLPVLSKDYAFAIVITPTIALATHQVDYLRSKNIMAYCWNAYTPNSIKYIIKKDLIKKKPKIKFLYISPEQCQSLHFQVIMAKVNLRISYYFVIDEAHCVSPSSHNFRKCYQSLDRIRTKYPHVPILAMSSTITKKIKEDVYRVLGLRDPLTFSMPVVRENLNYDVQFIDLLSNPLLDLKKYILRFLQLDRYSLSEENLVQGIIFCKKEHAKELHEELLSMGITTVHYNQTKCKERLKVQRLWDSGKCRIIIATSDFGIGISKPSVRFVIHWGVPQSIPHYYQETGRAGHDRCMSYCKIYCSLAEMHSSSETFLHGGNKNQPSQAALLAEIKQSLTHTMCRHVVLSKHFGQIVPNCMTKCDFCKSSIQMSPSVSNFNCNLTSKDKEKLSSNLRDNKKRARNAVTSECSSETMLNVSHPLMSFTDESHYHPDKRRKVIASEESDLIQVLLYR